MAHLCGCPSFTQWGASLFVIPNIIILAKHKGNNTKTKGKEKYGVVHLLRDSC
jgi:hypothetical protein